MSKVTKLSKNSIAPLFKWKKLGLVFSPSGQAGWMNSHAQVPAPILIDGKLRIYFSSRPDPNLSLTTYLDLDPEDPTKVICLHEKPILELGKPGTFDEFGIMPSCAIEHNGLIYLYYSGWTRCTSVPYHNTTGLAVSEDGGRTFKKIGEGPVLERTIDEPYSATSPFVMCENGLWHMWYASGVNWVKINKKWEHVYTIKYAQSSNGIIWERKNITAIKQKNSLECTVRPSIIKYNGTYHMWFCYRGSEDFRNGPQSYQIGYAESSDLREWQRNDTLSGITLSTYGEDSKMSAYPYVIKHRDKLLMFYNGNGFGKDGFMLQIAVY